MTDKKVNEAVVSALGKAKLDLKGVDLTRARMPKGQKVPTLPGAVRIALAHAPRVTLSEQDVERVKAWLLGQLKGQNVGEAALLAASYTAVGCFAPKPKQIRKPKLVQANGDTLTAAFDAVAKLRATPRKRRGAKRS